MRQSPSVAQATGNTNPPSLPRWESEPNHDADPGRYAADESLNAHVTWGLHHCGTKACSVASDQQLSDPVECLRTGAKMFQTIEDQSFGLHKLVRPLPAPNAPQQQLVELSRVHDKRFRACEPLRHRRLPYARCPKNDERPTLTNNTRAGPAAQKLCTCAGKQRWT